VKGKPIFQNKFKVIASRVIQCGVREEIKVRRQKVVEEVKYFRCWRIGHYKWKCPNIEVERRRHEKVAVYVVMPQKVQQKRRPV